MISAIFFKIIIGEWVRDRQNKVGHIGIIAEDG
jgi:hypothetical protein